MPIEYWTMTFCEPLGDGTFELEGTDYIRNDYQIHNLYLGMQYAEDSKDSEPEDEDCKPIWGKPVKNEMSYPGGPRTVDSVEELKAIIGAGAEETQPGCWATHGLVKRLRERQEYLGKDWLYITLIGFHWTGLDREIVCI